MAVKTRQLLDSLDIIIPGHTKSELVNIAIAYLVKSIKDIQDATGQKPKDIMPKIMEELGDIKYEVLAIAVTATDEYNCTLDDFIGINTRGTDSQGADADPAPSEEEKKDGE